VYPSLCNSEKFILLFYYPERILKITVITFCIKNREAEFYYKIIFMASTSLKSTAKHCILLYFDQSGRIFVFTKHWRTSHLVA
jgi:hypothetical protein